VTRKSHHLAKRQVRKTPTGTSKRRPNLMDRRRNFMGQKAPSQPDTVIGSKKAGVQIFDVY